MSGTIEQLNKILTTYINCLFKLIGAAASRGFACNSTGFLSSSCKKSIGPRQIEWHKRQKYR